MTIQIQKDKKGNDLPALTWDTCELAMHQAKYLRSEDPNLSDDEAFQMACEDQDLHGMAWDDLVHQLTVIMTRIREFDEWIVEVSNFGWRNQNGQKQFQAVDGATLLREILPKTDCTFKIFDRGDHIQIQNSHHDSPMGNEWYTIRPWEDEDSEEEEAYGGTEEET